MTSEEQQISLDSVVPEEAAFSSLTLDVGQVTLSEVSPIGFGSTSVNVDAYVKRLQAQIAGYLAIILWAGFLVTLLWHGSMISYLTYQMVQNLKRESTTSISSVNSEQGEKVFDKTSSLVGDTAKTLYAVLSPLATVVTSFYFSVKSSEADDSEEAS
jgi:hypothetical protein